MKLRLHVQAVQRSIRRHGGGLRGLLSVLRRAGHVLSAMGLRGLLARLRTASATRTPLSVRSDAPPLPPPLPLQQVTLSIGVMAHVFYADLIEEFADALACMPVPFTLLVSVVDAHTAALAQARFAQLPQVIELQVSQVANRGRDIAPLLVTFAERIRSLDVIGHIHTKKSLYTGSVQEQWRHYLLGSLFGSKERLAWLFGTMQAAPQLGLVYPETHESLPAWAHTWLSNVAAADSLAARLGLQLEHGGYFDYPAGSMFWARVDAFRPLFTLGLRTEDFPAEQGQTDGTLQHAVERLFGIIALHQGYRLGVLPADGSQRLEAEGERNVGAALMQPLAAQLQMAALQAELITLDVFDTLVTRPFLTPHAARQLLALRVEGAYAVGNFTALRDDAEAAARQQLLRDPTLQEIYQQLARQVRLSEAQAHALMELEVAMEQALLRPRRSVVDALAVVAGRRIAALSDMYLPAPLLQRVLPASVRAVTTQWWVSCETGLRKDDPDSWTRWIGRHGTPAAQWLHVGDNELSDVQLPQRAGLINPVHVLRPAAVLELVPALRPLRDPRGAQAPWSAQLWRGLLANRFAAIADLTPQRLLPRPRLDADEAGYAVLGPLLLDFLLATVSAARAHGAGSVLMLAREGHLLHQAWALLAKVHPHMSGLQEQYFLASRQATALPALAADGDLRRSFASPYNGTLRSLLSARLGEEVACTVAAMDPALADRAVFLPEMADEVEQWLQPALPAILAVAERARGCWAQVWREAAGSGQTMVVDLGYAGTIQRNLALMSGEHVGGMYFALRAAARQLDGHGWAEARYFDGRSQAGEDSPVLQHDLLLEALLSAPSGQFIGYRRRADGTVEAAFNPPSLSDAAIATLQEVHTGALQFIEDACAAIGGNVADFSLQPEEALIPLRLMAEGTWQAGAWLDRLATEDDFSGRGLVQARAP